MINYRTAYNRLIGRARQRLLASGIATKKELYAASGEEAGLQIHHVVPQSFGGKNIIQNLVLLTPNEHSWAHMLLNLALYQEKKFASLHVLNYTKVIAGLADALKHKNALRGLKVDVHVTGKKHNPATMSFARAAELFAFISRRDLESSANDMVAQVFRAALFNRALFGYKLKLHM